MRRGFFAIGGQTANKGAGLGVLVAVAVVVPTLSGGGFDAFSRSIFVVLGGLTLLAAAAVDGRAAAAAARSPLALTLVALAVLGVASAAWTIASPSSALRYGLVIAGYAAVFISATTLARATGPLPVAAGIAGLAVLEAVVGLRAVAFHALPDAERIVRAWRPGGTFQYPPALAILEVGALPVLSLGLGHRLRAVAAGAAAAAVLAGAVLRLADSRLAVALAVVLLSAMMLFPPPVRSGRATAAATAMLALLGAAVAPTILGGNVPPTTPGTGATGLTEIAAVAVAGAALWVLLRDAWLERPRVWGLTAGAVVVAALAAATLAGHVSGGPSSHAPQSRNIDASDVLHGRTHEWLAALQTWMDRPVLGAGADSYFVASLPHQAIARSRFAHNLPLELAAELGILGLLLGLALYASSAWTIGNAIGTPAFWLLAPTAAAFLASNLLDWTWHLAGLTAVWAAASGGLEAARAKHRIP